GGAERGTAEFRLEVGAQKAREQDGGPARRERHHDGDGPLRPSLLRMRRCCRGEDESGGQSWCEHSTHADPPTVRFLPSSPRTRGPIFQSRWLWVPSISAFTRGFDALCAGTTVVCGNQPGFAPP